ncbi:hypothetical protein Esi_0485_0011 [Ectocarpus siliculosus]|uniref:Uncharacterized protein n=1 Tax=Ectocarpus siliculosus TaxID=2880 RepID=D7G2T9_ECTSI|nr:hypothetical protein Esi_0485_0011 [Ectocarpus siliculosus]|eukprot:CBJ33443.1 hypothetical protein Esi_0485_0011 [Ectocarpus siliculosus]
MATGAARRMMSRRADLEGKTMLEANLFRRFLITDRFRSLRSLREKVQAMMDTLCPCGLE